MAAVYTTQLSTLLLSKLFRFILLTDLNSFPTTVFRLLSDIIDLKALGKNILLNVKNIEVYLTIYRAFMEVCDAVQDWVSASEVFEECAYLVVWICSARS